MYFESVSLLIYRALKRQLLFSNPVLYLTDILGANAKVINRQCQCILLYSKPLIALKMFKAVQW